MNIHDALNAVAAILNNVKQKEKTPYELGHNAGSDEYTTIFNCPYSSIDHSRDYKEWMRGFADGRRDAYTGGTL